MKRWGRLLFVFIAYCLALLHTAVPHHHIQSGSGGVVIAHKGCVLPHAEGLLQRVFSTDLGIGHLETFKKNSDTESEFSRGSSTIVAVEFSIDFQTIRAWAIPGFVNGFIHKLTRERLLFSVISFRAPPAL